MQDLARAAVASVVKAVVTKTAPAPVQGGQVRESTRHHVLKGVVSGGDVQVFNEDRSVHLSGTLPNLYESGSQSRIHLHVDGMAFSGFDYASQTRFSGRVTGATVLFHEFNTGKQYSFS